MIGRQKIEFDYNVANSKYLPNHNLLYFFQMDKEVSSENKSKTPFIDLWIKSMIIGREPDGYQVFQENFLRQSIKEFPFQESQLFKTLVTNFHHCQNYGEGATAAEYINQAFNGQKGFKDFENCDTCGSEKAESKCSKCKF